MILLCVSTPYMYFIFFFFNDTATTEIYTLSLHDALPIFLEVLAGVAAVRPLPVAHEAELLRVDGVGDRRGALDDQDRKSTRLNSSHANISYAVFCLKKKNKHNRQQLDTGIKINTCTSPHT